MSWTARTVAVAVGVLLALTAGTAVASAAPTLTIDGSTYTGEHVAGSPSTPIGGITGPLRLVDGDPCDPASYAGVAGTIVVLPGIADGGSCTVSDAVATAAAAGAIGVVILGDPQDPSAPESAIPSAAFGDEATADILAYVFGNPAAVGTLSVDQPPPQADVAVTVSGAPEPVAVGGTLVETITVTNTGPQDATGVVVTAAVPAGTTLLGTTTSQGSCTGTTTIMCSLGTLPSGASATIEVRLRPSSEGTLTFTASATAAEADPDATDDTATETTTVSGYQCSITGTAKSDVLVGTSGPDIICGGGGNDTIRGGGGDDILLGEEGNDRLSGEAGADQLFGGAGNDALFGGAGDDVLRGEAGNDELDGGTDVDACAQGPGNGAPVACEA